MQRIIAPAISLMNRLKYLQKFLLISILFAIPLVIVMSQYLTNVDHDIRFSAKEQLGLEYNAPLIDLLALVQRHSALTSASLSGATGYGQELRQVEQAIEAQIGVVDAVDAELGADLQATTAWAEIKDAWQTLRTAVPSLTAASSIERHVALSQQIRALVTLVGNTSNLILDPDIDSYYLMNSAITTLPLTIDYFSQLRSYGVSALASGVVSPSDATRLTILSGLADSALLSNIRSYAYSFEQNPALEIRLGGPSASNAEALNGSLYLLTSTLLEPGANELAAFTPEVLETFFATSSEAIDTSFSLYHQVSQSLDGLLQKRIDDFARGRTIVVLVTLVTLALTAYVFTGFYLSVKKTIAALSRASEQIIASQVTGDLVLESRDELAAAAVAFNNVAKNLDMARREAVEAARMKDLFLATMSHELRTPLNAMIGFLHLMLYSGQMDEDNNHMAERSLANAHRLLTLINNILDLSRISTGGLEIVPGDMSPRYVAAGLYNDLKPLAREKDLQFELEVDPTLPDAINQDETRVSQIVTNLVSNAIKFTEKGSIVLAFQRRDDRFIISVSDTGVGIPQSKQHLIFDDFFQVDGSSTRAQQGAGLGLAIVRRLVLLMKGSINLVSEVEKGSTFTVELPLDLPRYEPGDRRRQAEHIFAKSLAGGNGQFESAAPMKTGGA